MLDTTSPGGRQSAGAPPPWTRHVVPALAASLALGAGAALLGQGDWLASIQASLSGEQPKVFWYLSRTTALVGFALLWLSMLLGLAITTKTARLWPGGPAAADLHQYSSLLGLGFGCVHALLLLGDAYSNYTLAQLLVPFTSTQYRPVWVGLGQVGMYLGLLVALSFYARRAIGYRMWRLIHFASFAFFVLVVAHGVFSGTDSSTLWARSLYASSALSVLGLLLYRVRMARRS